MGESHNGPVRRRRAALLGCAAVLTGGVVSGLAGTAPAHADVAPGTGSSSSQIMQVEPTDGSLSIGVIEGEALAGHTNQSAKAQSQATDLGAVGESLTAENCGAASPIMPSQLPQPLVVETGDPGAANGVTDTDDGGADTRYGQVTPAPYAQAVTTLSPVTAPGGVAVGSGKATSFSGIVGGQRVAGGSVDISGINLPGGVSLSGLHWDAAYPSTGSAQPSGNFTYGSVTVNGLPLVPAGAPLSTVTAAVDGVLGNLGLQVTPPTMQVANGVVTVSPLTIAEVPNAARDALVNGAAGPASPSLNAGEDALLKAVCQSDSALTIANVAVAAVSGGGFVAVKLGGLSATSSALAANSYDLAGGGLGSGGPVDLPAAAAPVASAGAAPAPAPSVSSGSSGLGGGPSLSGTSGDGSSGSSGLAVAAPASDPATAATPAATASPVATGPLGPVSALLPAKTVGDALLLAGLAGLGLLGLLAEADRRMMRRAQRTVTSFED